ncbi:ribonuclease R [Oryzibacter oryziterrae]|uniref:ribonuclease R n=1 Tax=Oryzibacter oryziterrae TaxID=2766474 RepID=UPI001EFFA98A|nr:ribonuclease R [Oryzibacter oryziterrae]
MARKTRPADDTPAFPTREAILRFIAENPAKGTKRDIARAFDVTGEGRVVLKRLLKELEGDGLLDRRFKRFSEPGALPSVLACDIVARDKDGDIYAEPCEWEADRGPRPRFVVVAVRRRRGEHVPTAGLGDRVLARIVDLPDGYDRLAKAGIRIIKLLEAKPAGILGILKRNEYGARVLPISKKQQDEMIVELDDLNGAEDGDLVSVDVIRSSRMGLSRARVRETVGNLRSEKAVSMIAIHANDIPYIFPDNVIAEAEKAKAATLEGREDWRALPLVTIDPPDAKDHDDAVRAEPDASADNPDGFIVTVAIADVAAYVRPGTPLDQEALKRGNSVYFPDRVIPMLPEKISNDLCSLKELQDRPALAVRMIFDAEGRKRSHSFHRIMMRSAAKLSYQEAQAAIDGHPNDKTAPIVVSILKPLWNAYDVLARARDERGPLDLDIPERKVLLKPDGTVDRIVTPERLTAHRLIEEFMIQANVAAAETLEKRKTPLVYRVHDQPSLTKLESLREFLASLDMKLAKQGNLQPDIFNRILERVADTPQAHLVNEVVLRSQSQAEYSPSNIGHFGLNLRKYAHFTSPIRRYADLIVHRALVTALGLGGDGLPDGIEDKLEQIATDISAAERRAMAAERETIDRLIAQWLSDRVGATFKGRIGGVTKAGLFIRLNETGADGFVPISTLGADYFAYDETRHSLIGSRTGETFQLGDAVEVRLVEAAPFAGALRFEILSEGGKGKPLGKGAMMRAAKARKDRERKDHMNKVRRGR